MAADPAFYHRDGSGTFHAYDAATNALLEEAYRTQKTCRLPVPGMHLEVRFGAKATSDRVAVPPLSRIVQVNCGAQNTPTRVVLRVEAGEDPAAVYCALGAAADTSEKKLRHRYARLVALDGSDEADVHILRRESAAHRCRFQDGAEHVLSLRCRERAEDPHARPFRVLAEPPPWVLDQAAERAAARRSAGRDLLEMTVFAGRAVGATGVAEKDAAVSIKLKASVALPGFETKHSAKAVAAYPGVDCVFVDAATCVPPELSFRAPSGASLVITAFHKGGGLLGRANKARGVLTVPLDVLKPDEDSTGWLKLSDGGELQLRLRWCRNGAFVPTGAAPQAPPPAEAQPEAEEARPLPPRPPAREPSVDDEFFDAQAPPSPAEPPVAEPPRRPAPAFLQGIQGAAKDLRKAPAVAPAARPAPPSFLGGIADGAKNLRSTPATVAPPEPNFLSGIAGGAATLKKAPARPAPPQGLLAGIKGGAATLRHASQRKLKPVQKQGDLMSEIAAKLAERRGRIAAMQRPESDSDDDDGGWDDSD